MPYNKNVFSLSSHYLLLCHSVMKCFCNAWVEPARTMLRDLNGLSQSGGQGWRSFIGGRVEGGRRVWGKPFVSFITSFISQRQHWGPHNPGKWVSPLLERWEYCFAEKDSGVTLNCLSQQANKWPGQNKQLITCPRVYLQRSNEEGKFENSLSHATVISEVLN
jgi:hypothetical protein